MPIVVTQYIIADTNVVVIKDKNVSLILSDSNICMILNVNKKQLHVDYKSASRRYNKFLTWQSLLLSVLIIV